MLQHTAAATQPPIITAARNGGVAQVAPAAAARDFSREPTTTANPACSDGSPTKRARTDPDKHFAAKVAGIKRIASEPTKVAPKPVGGLIARAASDLAGATAGKGQSGRSGASRGSGQPARSHLARADSGSSRAASGGIKRSKSSSLTVIDLTSSAGSQGAAGAGCNPTHHQQQKQVSIAPVSLPTPRRPTRLGVIPVRLSEAAAEGRPAQTVMEVRLWRVPAGAVLALTNPHLHQQHLPDMSSSTHQCCCPRPVSATQGCCEQHQVPQGARIL